ncbi:diguanylate cyclase [Shewanella sp. D64]|uniref:diguanylate cyclase domain-containing protein n=1 Tax=unclassified Shewanella TaxID=196818 RepID=UPI0022BA517F|nr:MULTISPECIES: diguanylate cyclase [unclassified Shewanella]MEC4727486.1 diguanylate cyclase [Shewanella sp. D64]MEC4738105.1 diguanylate cyclase [Shewanella sp. E94]WBJ96381.1 diguanylate cyclase [Shewanella sp. MTB7]
MNLFSKYILFIAILVGVGFSVYIGRSLYNKESTAIELDFKKDVDDKAAALEREILLNIEVLHAIKGLFDSSSDVTSKEFNRIARSFLARHQDIQVLEWVPKVLSSQRVTFENSLHNELPEFEIIEQKRDIMISAIEREVHFPIFYVAPHVGNERVLGYDFASTEETLLVMERARDLDKPLATSSINLLSYRSDQQGIIIFLPIFSGDPSTLYKRQEQLRGFVAGVYRIDDMFGSAIKRTSVEGIFFSLEDKTHDVVDNLYTNFPIDHALAPSQTAFTYEKKLSKFSGRQWSIVATPSAGYIAERRGRLPYIIVIFGSLLALFATLYIYALMRRSDWIESVVKQRTHDLNEAKQKLEALSQTDSLTKIANRRCFDESLQACWQYAIREKSSIGLMMIDIDHFKLYNDTYGHLAGDQCLREVASALNQTMNRKTDLVARYGGEEFVVLMSHTRDCFSPAIRCQTNIELLALPHESSPTSEFVTVSVGVTSIFPDKDSDMLEFTVQADKALYQAKNSGRNRVCIFNDAADKAAGSVNEN